MFEYVSGDFQPRCIKPMLSNTSRCWINLLIILFRKIVIVNFEKFIWLVYPINKAGNGGNTPHITPIPNINFLADLNLPDTT